MIRELIYNRTLIVLIILLFSSCGEKDKIDNKSKATYLERIKNIDYSYILASQFTDYKLPSFSYYFENISQLSGLSTSINTRLTNLESFQDINHLMFTLIGIRTGGYGPTIITNNQNHIKNKNDLIHIVKSKNLKLNKKDTEEWNKLPFNFRKNVIELYLAVEKAEFLLAEFSNPLREYLDIHEIKSLAELHTLLIKPWKVRELYDLSLIDKMNEIDLVRLSLASRIISEKINHLLKYKTNDISDDFTNCQINSTMGKILINGNSNDTINGDHFLIIDFGGDDVYTGDIAASSPLNGLVNIVIDLNGDDKYITKGFLCSSILGFSALVDLNGMDEYFSASPGIASALFGTSILYDFCGNDIYTSTSEYSMGAAIFGASSLIDLDGDDNYNSVSYSQGFASTYGVGCLFDQNGDDHYNTDSTLYKNRYLPSFVQGASKGRWAEATDGKCLSGGIGILIDEKGSDEFYANSFSQGGSYYFGIGLFLNRIGVDRYNALSHSQGYAAHYALASFMDNEGDDIYNENSNRDKLTQIIGGGRDLSIGIFQDFKGNDQYYFGNRSVAIGDMNGIGIMIDYKGNDIYYWIENKKYSKASSMGKTFKVNQGMKNSRIHPVKNYSKGAFIDLNEKYRIEKKEVKYE